MQRSPAFGAAWPVGALPLVQSFPGGGSTMVKYIDVWDVSGPRRLDQTKDPCQCDSIAYQYADTTVSMYLQSV